MKMEELYEELDKVKAENEKLRADCKSKTESCENLKKAHNEQREKLQEACLKMGQQAQQLLEKEEQVSVFKQMYEDIKSNLGDKEAVVKSLSAANDKLRADADERHRTWEEEKRRLAFALDEANDQKLEQEPKINALRAELEGAKALLSASETKCWEVEKKAKNSKELREMDDTLLRTEEEKRKVEDQLKWKKEQFEHLKEAYEKLQNEFHMNKKEWEQERSTLLEEMCSLQTNLDSQMRISRDLQNRLEVCNQALAREETRRKYLEVEVSESRSRFDNVFSEYQDAKSQLECLSAQRDKEIAALRNSLGTKETFYKELEYQNRKLKQENDELMMSLKEFQEAKIQEVGSSSSLSKLRLKLKSVEQMHRDCLANHRGKEAEWKSRLEKMLEELNDCRSHLGNKDTALKKLEMEFESCLSSAMQLQLQNEEISVMFLVLKSGFSEAQLNLETVQAQLGLHNKEKDKNASSLMQQLELKDAALAKAKRDLADECEKTEVLSRRIESLQLAEERKHLMQKELDRYKEMLEDSCRQQVKMKEQVFQVENCSKEKIKEVCDALDCAHLELAEERKKTASLLRRIESMDLAEKQQQQMEKELEKCKEMLEEMCKSRWNLEEHALLVENESKKKLEEVCEALQSAVTELDEERERVAALTKRVESLEHNEEQWLLMQKEVCDALESAVCDLAEERDRAAALAKRVESLEDKEEQWLLVQKEVERYNEIVEASSRHQLQLEEKLSNIASDSERKLREVHDKLDKAHSELLDRTCEGHELEFELWIWRSIAKQLKFDLEKSNELRKELEDSLLQQVEDGETIKQEKKSLFHILEEKDSRLNSLESQILSLEQEPKTQVHEKESLFLLAQQKDRQIEELMQVMKSMEEKFSSQLAEKQTEINLVYDAWEKIARAEILAEVEAEEKKLIAIELENDIWKLQEQLVLQEMSLSVARRQTLEIKAQLEAKLRTSDALVNELEREKLNLQALIENLRVEQENLFGFILILEGNMSELSREDTRLVGMLGRMVESFGNHASVFGSKSECFDYAKENIGMRSPSTPTMKKLELMTEERSPFRLLN